MLRPDGHLLLEVAASSSCRIDFMCEGAMWLVILRHAEELNIEIDQNATVTPSLVMCGAPKLFSITTLRPFGPSVTFTALASASTPAFNLSLASVLNEISFAIFKFFFELEGLMEVS